MLITVPACLQPLSGGNHSQLYTGHHFFPLSQSRLDRISMSPGVVQSPGEHLGFPVSKLVILYRLSFLSLHFFIWKLELYSYLLGWWWRWKLSWHIKSTHWSTFVVYVKEESNPQHPGARLTPRGLSAFLLNNFTNHQHQTRPLCDCGGLKKATTTRLLCNHVWTQTKYGCCPSHKHNQTFLYPG